MDKLELERLIDLVDSEINNLKKLSSTDGIAYEIADLKRLLRKLIIMREAN